MPRLPRLRDADLDDMMGMKAVGVTPDYIRDLAAAGFRDLDADDLTEARAVGVTPNIFARCGRPALRRRSTSSSGCARSAVTPAYAEQFRRVGLQAVDEEAESTLAPMTVDIDELRSVAARAAAPACAAGHQDNADDE